jgi:hypothetical protein
MLKGVLISGYDISHAVFRLVVNDAQIAGLSLDL